MQQPMIKPAPVRRSILVDASPERAFNVFTAGIGRWWPRSHHIGAADPETFMIEPRAGGRWFERSTDGVECEIGKVLVWEPPTRLILAWQLSTAWRFDPALVTEVEVRFTREGDKTRVELEHRNLERFGTGAEAMRQQIDGPEGWAGLLQLFAQFVSQSEGEQHLAP
jgi:uncharacterized protein YndB with AHSA1/START domain